MWCLIFLNVQKVMNIYLRYYKAMKCRFAAANLKMSNCHHKGMQITVNDCNEILVSGDDSPLAHSLKLMQ